MPWNLEEALAYYKRQGAPGDQNALIGLLKEIQANSGGSIPISSLTHAASVYQIKESLLHALIRRVPTLRMGDRHVLQVCAGPNCGKSAALAAFAEELCSKKKDTVTLQFTPCMRMCGKGPNIKYDGQIFHKVTPELLEDLMK